MYLTACGELGTTRGHSHAPGVSIGGYQQSLLTGSKNLGGFTTAIPTATDKCTQLGGEVLLSPIPFIFVMFSPSFALTMPIPAISQAISTEGTCNHFPAPCKHSLHLNWDVDFSVLLLNK